MIEYARQAFDSVFICKLLHQYGKLGNIAVGWSVDEESWWPLVHEALGYVCDKVWIEELDMALKYYFSDPAMMEYYHLCREYSRKTGISLKQNPFMLKAQEKVCRMLQLSSYGYRWTLLTKINHEWASGIVFGEYEDFNAHLDLLDSLLEIFRFYETELEVLKQTLLIKNTKEAA